MNHLEIEYKTLLTAEEFHHLQHQLGGTPVLQTNYYIDTTDRLVKQARMSLRIRVFKTRAELTLKVPQKVGNFEYNQEIEFEHIAALLENFDIPEGTISEQLTKQAIPLEKLHIWGHLQTKRYEHSLAIGLLALDENHYEDQHDYELELEVTDPNQGKVDFEAFLKKEKITFKYATSKVARLAAYLSSAK